MLDSGAPRETLLHDSEWRCFVKFADVVPQLDEILSYRNSLEHVSNAMYNLLSEATLVKIFCLTNEIRLALLSCYKELNEDRIPFLANMLNFMKAEKWLHPTHGFCFHRRWSLCLVVWCLTEGSQRKLLDDSVVILIAWEIWKERSEMLVFSNRPHRRTSARMLINSY